MKLRKRLLTLLMAAAMVLTYIPAFAFADADTDTASADSGAIGLADLPPESEIPELKLGERIDITDMLDGNVHTYYFVSSDSNLYTDLDVLYGYDGNYSQSYDAEFAVFTSEGNVELKGSGESYSDMDKYEQGTKYYIQFRHLLNDSYNTNRYYLNASVTDFSLGEIPENVEELAEGDVKTLHNITNTEVITYKVSPADYPLSLSVSSTDPTDYAGVYVFAPGYDRASTGYIQDGEAYEGELYLDTAYTYYVQVNRGWFGYGAETADLTIKLDRYKEKPWAPVDSDCPEIEVFKTTDVTIADKGGIGTVKFTADEDGVYTIESVDSQYDVRGSVCLEDELLVDDGEYRNHDFTIKVDAVKGTTYYIQTKFVSSTRTGSFTLSLERAHKHTPVKTAAKDPTETEAGNTVYYTCSVCDRIFSNSKCTNQISIEDTVIPALGPAQPMHDTIALPLDTVIKASFITEEGGYQDFTLTPEKDGMYAVNIILSNIAAGDLTSEDAMSCEIIDGDGNSFAPVVSQHAGSYGPIAYIMYLEGGKTYTMRLSATLQGRIKKFLAEDIEVYFKKESDLATGGNDGCMVESWVPAHISYILKFSAPYDDTYEITVTDRGDGTGQFIAHLIDGNGTEVLKTVQPERRKIEGTESFTIDLSKGYYYVAVICIDNYRTANISFKGTKCEHKAGSPVEENRVEATCSAEGSYDEVIYCTKCKAEISRTAKSIDKKPHTPGEAVQENHVAATCESAGSYDEVICCTECNVEISRNKVTVNAKGHNWGTPSYTWAEDNTSVTASHTCSSDVHEGDRTVSETRSTTGEVIKAPSLTEKGIMRYTSESFTDSCFTVQTKDAEIPKKSIDEALEDAEAKAGIASENAKKAETDAENSTDSTEAQAAEDSAQNAVNMAAVAVKAAEDAYAAAKAEAEAKPDDETAQKNLNDATKTLATAKGVKAAANYALATSKKASAKVAANKAAAAKKAAASASTSAQASSYEKQAAEAADEAARKAADAKAAAAEAQAAADDLADIAADADAAVKQAIEDAKNEADKAAENASSAAEAAGKSSAEATQSKTDAEASVKDKAASEQKAAAAKAAADQAAAAAKADADKTNPGTVANVSGNTVKVLTNVNESAPGTVIFTKAGSKKSVTVPNTVIINGKTFKVTQIAAKAFTGKKIRTVTIGTNVSKIAANAFNKSKATKMIVKTKLLKKAGVKKALKGSKIKTVQVKVGSKKINKKFVKSYKKIFTKKVAGKKVTVK